MAAMRHQIKHVEFIESYLNGIFAENLHAKRISSLANGALGDERFAGRVDHRSVLGAGQAELRKSGISLPVNMRGAAAA